MGKAKQTIQGCTLLIFELNGEKLQFSRRSCFVVAWDIARRCCIWLSHEDHQTSLSQPLQLAYLALEMYSLNPLAYMHLKFVAQMLISRGSVHPFIEIISSPSLASH